MKIPKFDDNKFKSCSNCQSKKYEYTSKKCLHKLCENCYKKLFLLIESEYNCKNCTKDGKHLRDDYINKCPLQDFYDKDKIKREKIIYMDKENFPSIDDYNDYLEFVEKCLRKNNLKEIDKKYNQEKNEREKNLKKRSQILEKIKEEIKENSPTNYNNSKIIINFDDNNDEIVKKATPIQVVQESISYVQDNEKEKITGGYIIKNIYEFFGNFSKGGLMYDTKK